MLSAALHAWVEIQETLLKLLDLRFATHSLARKADAEHRLLVLVEQLHPGPRAIWPIVRNACSVPDELCDRSLFFRADRKDGAVR